MPLGELEGHYGWGFEEQFFKPGPATGKIGDLASLPKATVIAHNIREEALRFAEEFHEERTRQPRALQ